MIGNIFIVFCFCFKSIVEISFTDICSLLPCNDCSKLTQSISDLMAPAMAVLDGQGSADVQSIRIKYVGCYEVRIVQLFKIFNFSIFQFLNQCFNN